MELPNISKIIRNRRKELGLTMEDVASKMGLYRSTICRWEQGYIKGLRRSDILSLSEILEVPVEALLGSGEIEDAEVVKKRKEVIELVKTVKDINVLDQILRIISVLK